MKPWEILIVVVLIGPLVVVLAGMTIEFTRCGLEEILTLRKKYAKLEPRGEIHDYIDEVKLYIRIEKYVKRPS